MMCNLRFANKGRDRRSTQFDVFGEVATRTHGNKSRLNVKMKNRWISAHTNTSGNNTKKSPISLYGQLHFLLFFFFFLFFLLIDATPTHIEVDPPPPSSHMEIPYEFPKAYLGLAGGFHADKPTTCFLQKQIHHPKNNFLKNETVKGKN